MMKASYFKLLHPPLIHKFYPEIRLQNKRLMEEEAKDDEDSEEEGSPLKKRVRTGVMVLDNDEANIASSLRPIQRKSPSISLLQESTDGSQNSGDSGKEKEEGTVDDYSGDRLGVVFENNGVRLSNPHMILI